MSPVKLSNVRASRRG